MAPITRAVCIYAAKSQTWAIELSLGGTSPGKIRLTLRGPEHVETFLDAFDDCDHAAYDEASGEVRFVFDGEEEEEEEEEDDEANEDEDGATDDACEVEARPGENDGGFAGEITTKDSP